MNGLPPIFSSRRRRGLFLRLIVNGFLQAAMIIGSMLLLRYAFDVLLNPAFDDPEVHLFETTEVKTIILFAAGLLTTTGGVAWLRQIERVDAERLGQDYIHKVRLTLYDRMSRFAPRATSRRSTGTAMLRFVGDLSALRRWVSLGLARIVVASIVTGLSFGYLMYIDLYLATVVFVLLAIGLTWNLRLGPRMHQSVSESRRRRGRLAANINEKIRSYIVIQAFNQEQRERERFSRHSRRLREAMTEQARSSSIMRVVNDGATATAMGLVLSLGAFEVFRGMTTSGNVVAAMAVIGFLSTSFRDIGRVHEYFQSARISEQKIIEFMRTKRLRGRSPDLPSLVVTQGAITFEEVSLSGSLQQINATAPGGARIALVGPNGAGKSTLLHVAARLIDPDSGRVLIDGQPLSECNLASVRSAIGVVSQDLPLLRGSLGYNLRYRRPEAPDEEVARVRTLCALDDLLEGLPRGEDTRLEESGKNLSLGQRHRLCLARALLGNPSILILDEIDANLDAQALRAFEQVLDTFQGTVLMVTRAETVLERADAFWHMADGQLLRIEQRQLAAGEAAG